MRMSSSFIIAGVVAMIFRPTAADPLAIAFPQLSVASDYRFFGLSNSDREPAIQASLYLRRPDNWFGGVWFSEVDFVAPGSPSYEVSVYGGRNFEIASLQLSFWAMGTFYPDDDLAGPTLNFVQGIAKVERDVDSLKLRAETAWSPSGSSGVGNAWRFQGAVDLNATEWLTFGAVYGAVLSDRGQNRRYWEYAATAKSKWLAFDVRYVDTNLEREQCFFTDWCEDALVGKVTWNIPIGGWRTSDP